MRVRFSETVEVDSDRSKDIIAFAGFLGVYQHGMKNSQAVKAIMAVRGTTWLQELQDKYPRNNDYDQKKGKTVNKSTPPSQTNRTL